MGLTAVYAPIHVGAHDGHSAYVRPLVAMGAGASAGPQISRVSRARYGARATGLACCVAGAVALSASALLLPGRGPVLGATGLVIAQLCAWGIVSVLIGERQVQLQGEEFVNDTVWCRAGGALGAVAGSWLALSLDAASAPSVALWVGAAAYALLAVYLRGGEEEPADPRDRRRQE
ncbi:hypothetical protein [Actinomyces gerencseriae]|jgi:hypothetical protein|uniref:hypothetical protein n=1 Tax=Actinomyces gerencseriae TaxID=52769 RepID=UPI0023EFB7F9|nr:hypothetical protein [Actinomyces gerencseriae]